MSNSSSTSKSLCALPWVHIASEPTGHLRPCCINREYVTDSEGKPFFLHSTSVHDVFHSEFYKKMRQDFRDGLRPESCKSCWVDEDAGKKSKRMIYNESLSWKLDKPIDYQAEPEYPFEYQIILSNACNLKCRSCNGIYSSKWAQETVDRGLNRYMPNFPANPQIMWQEDSEFKKSYHSWMPSVRILELMGGEPFFSKELPDFLYKFIENNWAHNVMIMTSSNCTHRPEKLIEDVVNHFKFLGLSLSIDGIGDRYGYLRSGGDWRDVRENLKYYFRLAAQPRFKDKISLNLNLTITWLNVYYLDELLAFLDDNFPTLQVTYNIAHFPEMYSICNLPAEVKSEVALKLSKYSNYKRRNLDSIVQVMMDAQADHMQFETGIVHTIGGDRYRHESFPNVFPEFFDLISRNWAEVLLKRNIT